MSTLRSFDEWRTMQQRLQVPKPRGNTLLLIRLDDIGDYLLFRNQLAMYKRSARWRAHSITLLGNSSWKEVFAAFDSDTVDDTIWVNKRTYLTAPSYRTEIWAQLRERGFETVIAPSRTRPLLLDDLCRLAAAPSHSIGCENTYVHTRWNQLSDSLYHELFTPLDAWVHEFHFNGQFSTWVCGLAFAGNRPIIGTPRQTPGAGANSDLICFVGANTRSRRWPASRWIEFIKLYRHGHEGPVVLAGSSRAEQEMAARIQKQTDAQSIVGKVSLPELIRRMGEARAVLSNDTMAVHLSVACSRPTVIVANGVNHQRFTDYDRAGIAGVVTLYPQVFLRRRDREPRRPYHYADALTSDIASIAPGDALAALNDLLKAYVPAPPA